MKSPPPEQVITTTSHKPKTPASVKKIVKRVLGSAKKRKLDANEKLAKRHKPSNEFSDAMIQKVVPRRMVGTTKLLTEMALNSPRLAQDKMKKVKGIIAHTPTKVAGMMKRNRSIYGRTPKGETRAVDEWNKRIVRKESIPAESSTGTLWAESEWALLHKDLSPLEKNLQEIFNEFIVKELAYTDSIQQIMDVYMKAFRTCDLSQFDDTPTEIAEDLFANIQDIVQLQKSFKAALEDLRTESNGYIRNFGDFFTTWFAKCAPYVPYCGHIGAMKKRYDALKDKSEDFSRLVKQLQLLEKCDRKDLWTLLDEPRRHFLRYNLMLKTALGALLKIQKSKVSAETVDGDVDEEGNGHAVEDTEMQEDPDIASLTDALQVINQIGEEMNKGLDVIGDYLTMRALRNNICFTNEEERQGFEIPENSMLLFHGMLTNRDGKGLHVFLGSHYLVFTRECRRNGKQHFQVPRNMKPISVKDLDVRIVEMNDPGAMNFGRSNSMLGRKTQNAARKNADDYLSMMHVVDHGDQAIHTLKARSQEGRDAWIHAIREVGVVANVKSQVSLSASKPLKRVQLMDLSALPSPTPVNEAIKSRVEPECSPQDKVPVPVESEDAGTASGSGSPVAASFNIEGGEHFLQLRSKLQFAENTPHVTPPRPPSVRDNIVGEGDATIKKINFAAGDSSSGQVDMHDDDVQKEKLENETAMEGDASGACSAGDDVGSGTEVTVPAALEVKESGGTTDIMEELPGEEVKDDAQAGDVVPEVDADRVGNTATQEITQNAAEETKEEHAEEAAPGTDTRAMGMEAGQEADESIDV